MASFLSGLTILENIGFFSVVIPLLFISVLVYAILAKTKALGDSQAINVVVGLLVGFIFINVMPATAFLGKIIPFATGLVVIIFLVLMVVSFTGGSFEHTGTTIIAIVGFSILILGTLIIFVTSFDSINPLKEYEYSEGEMNVSEEIEYENNTSRNFLSETILNPAIIAVILLILMAGLTAYLIAK